MRAEDLLTLAAAHGVDLVQAARLAAPQTRQATLRRRGTNGHTYEVLAAPSAHRANGHPSRSSDRPSWTLAELGQAAAGVPQVQFMAACYALAGDRSVYWKLFEALHLTALRLRTRNNWPLQVCDTGGIPHFYLEELVQLVLEEDAQPYLFNAAPATEKHPSLYAIYLKIDERAWRRNVFERFDQVRLRFQGWIAQAIETMRPRLQELDGDGD